MNMIDWVIVFWILSCGLVTAGACLLAQWYSDEADRWRDRYHGERRRRQEEAWPFGSS